MDSTLFEKLTIPQDADVCVIEAPDDYPTDSVDIFTAIPGSQFDVVQVYVEEPEMFAEEVAEGERLMKRDGALWVMTPSDSADAFGNDFIATTGQPLGLQPTENVQLDDGWNATKMEIV